MDMQPPAQLPCTMAAGKRMDEDTLAWDDIPGAARELCLSMSGLESCHSSEGLAH